jgi:hypothetical protein
MNPLSIIAGGIFKKTVSNWSVPNLLLPNKLFSTLELLLIASCHSLNLIFILSVRRRSAVLFNGTSSPSSEVSGHVDIAS